MADRLRIVEGIRKLLVDEMIPEPKPSEVRYCDLMVRTPAGFAFFHVLEPRADIVDIWRSTQDEIALYLRKLSMSQPRPGAYLTLLSAEDHPANEITLQKIAGNPYVCRKVILSGVTEANLKEKVWELPFFPLPPGFQRNMSALPADPAVVLNGTQLTAGLMDRFVVRSSDEATKADLLAGLFDGNLEPLQSALSAPDVVLPKSSGQRLKVRKVQLSNFRNYGPEFPLELSGDLVVIFGRNGTGKTSLCEGLEWAITGQSRRVMDNDTDEKVQQSRSPLVNLRTGVRSASVDVWLEGKDQIHIRRSISEEGKATVELNGKDSKERAVLGTFSLVDDNTSIRVDQNLKRATQECHFLDQQLILDFLYRSPAKRYEGYSFMAGTQQLAFAIRKADRLLNSLIDDTKQHQLMVNETDLRLKQSEEARAKLLGAVADGEMKVSTPADLVRDGQDLLNKAGLIGLRIESPRASAGIVWSRLTADALVSLAPKHLDELRRRHLNLQRLQQELERVNTARTHLIPRREELAQLSDKDTLLLTEINSLKERQVGLAKTLADLESDLTSATGYRDRIKQLLILADRQLRLRDDLATAQAALVTTESGLRSLTTHLTNLKAQQAEAIQAQTALSQEHQHLLDTAAALQQSLDAAPQRLAMEQQIADHRGQIADLSNQIDEKSREIERLRGQQDAANAHLGRQEAGYNEFKRLVARRQELLAELKTHIHGHEQECPVCGASYPEAGGLLARFTQRLESLPDGLQPIAEALAEAAQAVDEGTHALTGAEGDWKRLNERKIRAIAATEALVNELAMYRAAFAQRLPQYAEIWLEPQDLQQALEHTNQKRLALQEKLKRALAAVHDLVDQVAQASADHQAVADKVETTRSQIDKANSELALHHAQERALALPFSSREEAIGALQDHEVKLGQLQETVHARSQELAGMDRQIQEALATRDNLATEISTVKQQISSLSTEIHAFETDLKAEGIVTADPVHQAEWLSAAMDNRALQIEEMTRLLPSAQQFLARVSAYGNQQELARLDTQIAELRQQRQEAQIKLERLYKYRDKVGLALANLQKLKADEDAQRLQGLEPLAAHLYRRFNAHPFFGDLDLEVNSKEEELYVRFKAEDNASRTVEVNRYFSTAQANSVALSIFMGSALVQSWTNLGIICMDDPVQHLDDINVYALLDLVHTLVQQDRQVIITTASEDLYKLMLWRFQPLNTPGKTRFQAYRMIGAAETGPEIKNDTPKSDPEPVRLTVPSQN